MPEILVRIYENGSRKRVQHYDADSLAEIISSLSTIMASKLVSIGIDDEGMDLTLFCYGDPPKNIKGSLIRINPDPHVRRWSEYVQLHFVDPALVKRL